MTGAVHRPAQSSCGVLGEWLQGPLGYPGLQVPAPPVRGRGTLVAPVSLKSPLEESVPCKRCVDGCHTEWFRK